MLQVGGLRLNRTEKVGLYYCQLTLELNDEETIASNASIALEILPSSSYTDLDKCDPDRLFLTLAPACLSLGSNVSLPSTSPPPVVMTTVSALVTYMYIQRQLQPIFGLVLPLFRPSL